MNKKEKITSTQFLDKAFDKMFQVVGFEKWDKEFSKQEDWYLQKSWTIEQRDEFKNWFVSEIKNDFKLKKTEAQKEWEWFDLMWGWKEYISEK